MTRINVLGPYGAAAALILAAGCTEIVDRVTPPPASMDFQEGSAGFMPVGVLDPNPAGIFSWILSDMGEPRLYGARLPVGVTVIRLLWIPIIEPPVVVRIVKTAERCVVTTVVLGTPKSRWSQPDSNGLMTWVTTTPVQRRDSVELAVGRCAEANAAAIAAGVWSGPSNDVIAFCAGYQVVFELATSTGYQVRFRFAPREGHSPEFMQIAGMFLSLGGHEF